MAKTDMGWTLTKVNFRFEEKSVDTHADGNNMAWCCPCGAPILFTYQSGRKGSSRGAPVRCAKCQAEYFLEPSYGAMNEPPPGESEWPSEIMRIIKNESFFPESNE